MHQIMIAGLNILLLDSRATILIDAIIPENPDYRVKKEIVDNSRLTHGIQYRIVYRGIFPLNRATQRNRVGRLSLLVTISSASLSGILRAIPAAIALLSALSSIHSIFYLPSPLSVLSSISFVLYSSSPFVLITF